MVNHSVTLATAALGARFAGYFQVRDVDGQVAVLQLNQTRIMQERQHMLRNDLIDYARSIGLFGQLCGAYQVEITVPQGWHSPAEIKEAAARFGRLAQNDKTPGT
jgi:hypothetical protein